MSYKRLRASGLQRNSDSSRMRAAGKRRDGPSSNQSSRFWGHASLPCHLPCPPCLSRSCRALTSFSSSRANYGSSLLRLRGVVGSTSFAFGDPVDHQFTVVGYVGSLHLQLFELFSGPANDGNHGDATNLRLFEWKQATEAKDLE